MDHRPWWPCPEDAALEDALVEDPPEDAEDRPEVAAPPPAETPADDEAPPAAADARLPAADDAAVDPGLLCALPPPIPSALAFAEPVERDPEIPMPPADADPIDDAALDPKAIEEVAP